MLASPILQGLLQMRYLRGSLKPVSLVLARKPAPCLSRRYIQRHRARTHQACWDRREDLHIGRVYSPRVNRPRRLLFCGQIWPEIPWSCPTVCVWICILITFFNDIFEFEIWHFGKKISRFPGAYTGTFRMHVRLSVTSAYLPSSVFVCRHIWYSIKKNLGCGRFEFWNVSKSNPNSNPTEFFESPGHGGSYNVFI